LRPESIPELPWALWVDCGPKNGLNPGLPGLGRQPNRPRRWCANTVLWKRITGCRHGRGAFKRAKAGAFRAQRFRCALGSGQNRVPVFTGDFFFSATLRNRHSAVRFAIDVCGGTGPTASFAALGARFDAAAITQEGKTHAPGRAGGEPDDGFKTPAAVVVGAGACFCPPVEKERKKPPLLLSPLAEFGLRSRLKARQSVRPGSAISAS